MNKSSYVIKNDYKLDRGGIRKIYEFTLNCDVVEVILELHHNPNCRKNST